MRHPALTLFLAAALVAAAAVCGAQCLQPTDVLLFDRTWDNGVATPANPRALGVGSLRWGGHDYLVVNEGNQLRLWDVTDRLAPTTAAISGFPPHYDGDFDYNLFNVSTCNDCRYAVASFRLKGAELIDLGIGPTPSFRVRQHHPLATSRGAFTFNHEGQQYLIINGLPSSCGPRRAALFAFDGVDLASLTELGCVLTGGNRGIEVNGGYLLSGPGGSYAYLVDSASQIHIFRVEGSACSLQLVFRGAPLRGGWVYGRGVRIDQDAGLLVTASGYAGTQLWDVSVPDAPVELLTWQPDPASIMTRAAIRWPLLYVAAQGLRVSHTFDISTPASPVEIAADYWDPANPWNTLTYLQDRDAEWSPEGSALYLARYSAVQVVDSAACAAEVSLIFADGFEMGETGLWDRTINGTVQTRGEAAD